MGDSITRPRLHLVTFGDKSLYRAKRRFARQARRMKIFDSISIWDESDLDNGFASRNRERLRKQVRGFGFWLWKPAVIAKALGAVEENAILIYADIGFHLNHKGRSSLEGMLEKLTLSTKPILAFNYSLPTSLDFYDGRELEIFRDSEWTKGDLLEALNMRSSPKIYEPTITAGLIVIKNVPSSRDFVNRWLEFMEHNPRLVDDTPSVSKNLPGFQENRHDQSVFSLMLKQEEIMILESSFRYWFPVPGDVRTADWIALENEPFLAKRDLGGKKFSAKKFVRQLWRTPLRFVSQLVRKFAELSPWEPGNKI